jgi:hypothetical protein
MTPTPPRCWTARDATGSITAIALRAPALDEASAAALEEAIASLGAVRGLEWVGDDGVVVHLLASLIAQATVRLDTAIAGALDQGYTPAELAHLLGTSEADLHERFSQQL